jgi:hypothetical protein
MEVHHAKRRPSKKLTNAINTWYCTEKSRLEAARRARALDSSKQELAEKVLGYIDQGFTLAPGSPYGVAVLEQSGRIAYEKLYKDLVNVLSEKYSHHAGKIQEISANLERQALSELETRRVVVCDANENLEKLVKNTEKAALEDRKTKHEIELVIYT